jgi:hypothetical protein
MRTTSDFKIFSYDQMEEFINYIVEEVELNKPDFLPFSYKKAA